MNELYKIINIKKFIKSNYVEKLEFKNIKRIYKIEEKKIKSKQDLMKYKFRGFEIGIDIYETYLSDLEKLRLIFQTKI